MKETKKEHMKYIQEKIIFHTDKYISAEGMYRRNRNPASRDNMQRQMEQITLYNGVLTKLQQGTLIYK